MAKKGRSVRNNHRPLPSEGMLQEAQNGIAAFMDASVDAFLLFDENLNLVSINPAGERMLAISKEVVEGKNILDFAPEIKKTGRYDKYLNVIRTGDPFFAEDIFLHPRFGDMHLSVKAFKMRKGLGMIVNDITGRKRVEEALKHSEKYFRALIENSLEAIVIMNADGTVGYESPSIERVLGYRVGELTGKNAFELVYPDDLPDVTEAVNQLLQHPGMVLKVELRARHKDGSWHNLEVIGNNLSSDPAVAGIVVNFRDITERKGMEEALRESELVATATIEGMSDGVMLVSMDGTVAYINKAFEKILGYKAEELVGTSAVELPTYRGSKDKKKARQALKKVIEKGSTEPIDMAALTKDGEEIPISFSASVIKDAKGNPKTLVAVIRDITERKRMEEELREGEKRLRDIVEHSREWIWEVDTKGKYTYSSPIVESILGYTSEEILEKHFYDLFHPDDRESLKQVAFKAFAGKEPFRDFVNRNISKDGRAVWLLTSGIPLLDEAGNLTGYRGSDIDVTERKNAEELLKVSEERYRLVVENANEAIVVAQDGVLKFFNSRVPEILGFSREEISSRSFIGFIHPDDQQAMMERYIRRFKGEGLPRVYSFRVIDKDGNVRWVENSVVLFEWEGRPATLIFLSDITERKEAEETLRESEERYKTLVDAAGRIGEGIVIVQDTEEREGVIVFVNDAIERMSGYSREEMLKMPFDEFLSQYSAVMVHEDHERGQRGGEIPSQYELAAVRKDGTQAYLDVGIGAITYQGKPATVAYLRDITERKRMEEELRLLSDAVKMTTESVAIADLKGRIVDINEAGLKMYGLDDRADLVGKNPFDIIVPEDQPKALENMAKIMETGAVKDIEYRIRRKDGREALIETSVSLIKGGKGEPKGIVAVARDITERRGMEEALRYSEEYFRALTEDSSDGILVLDNNANICYEGPSMERVLGYRQGEQLGNSVFQFVHRDDVPNASEEFAELLREAGTSRKMGLRSKHKDGSWRTLEVIGTNLLSNPAVGGVVINFRDITERRKAEEEIRRLSDAVRMSTDGVVVTDIQGRVLDANEAALKLYGANGEADLIGTEPLASIIPEDRKKALKNMAKVLETGYLRDIQYHILTRDSRKILIETSISIIKGSKGEPKGLVAVARDITERRRMEEALRKSEAQLRTIFDEAAIGIMLLDMNAKPLEVNHALLHMLGCSMEDFGNMSYPDYVHPEDLVNDAELFGEMVRGERDNYHIEKRFIRKDGGLVWTHQTFSLIRDTEGKPQYLVVLVEDITERKKAEEALRESEEHLRRLVDEAPDIIFRWSAEKGLEYCSPIVSEITGYTIEELLADPMVGLELAKGMDSELGEDYEKAVKKVPLCATGRYLSRARMGAGFVWKSGLMR